MNTPTDLRSPYQPPAAELSHPAELSGLPPHERSGAPKVFGVLSIIFASLVLFGSAMGLLVTAATVSMESMSSGVSSPDAEKTAQMKAMIQPMAKVYKGLGLQCLITFVMSALLLAIGIGQVRYRAWAGSWSVYWGAAGLACVVLMVVISLLIISPACGELLEAASRVDAKGDGAALPSAMGGMTALFGGTFAVLNVILYAPYPTLMLLFFTRPRVRASMTK